jgi:hypothetical protein
MDITINTNLFDVTSGTSTFNNWFAPERVGVVELHDKIEFIYKETSKMALAVYPARVAEQRVFKIVFSCIDGKWNKSDRVYGNIITATPESYSF